MNETRKRAIRELLEKLTIDFVDTQKYFDDLEPMSFYDSILGGKIQALIAHLRRMDRTDLSEALEAYLPLNGRAIQTLTFITDHVTPEVLADLEELENTPSTTLKISASEMKDTWKQIHSDYKITKREFGKRINFVGDKYKRTIIFRDIEQAYILSQHGFNKPAVILAGGVIEELLRLLLLAKGITTSKNTFDNYIKECETSGFLEPGIHRLTDSVRYFRNIVHLAKENSRWDCVKESTAKGAVASVFTIIDALKI